MNHGGRPLPPAPLLVSWVDGYLAGWARGRDEGRAEADALLVDALTRALGGPDCTSPSEAVRRHQAAVDRRARRAAADTAVLSAGDRRGGRRRW